MLLTPILLTHLPTQADLKEVMDRLHDLEDQLEQSMQRKVGVRMCACRCLHCRATYNRCSCTFVSYCVARYPLIKHTHKQTHVLIDTRIHLYIHSISPKHT